MKKELTNWIAKNPIKWEKICGLRFITIDEMKELNKELELKGFLELSELMGMRLYAALMDMDDETPKY